MAEAFGEGLPYRLMPRQQITGVVEQVVEIQECGALESCDLVTDQYAQS